MNDTVDVRIALPGCADALARARALGDGVRLPAAEWLFARGASHPAEDSDWRRWLLRDAGLGADVLERFAAGPCALAARTGRVPEGVWACAEPVHLLTALDHLQLGAPVPVPLETDERDELIEVLNRHFAATGFRLHAAGQGGWLCECPPGLRCVAVEPATAIGANLRDLLPGGADAARVGSFVNEAQMLLHDHPVNLRRAGRGALPVNSIWLWGIGVAGGRTASAQGVLVSDDDWLAGLWRLHGGETRPVADLGATLDRPEGVVRFAIAPDSSGRGATGELARVERDVFEPLRARLVAGTVRAARVYLGTHALELDARARWRFWRRARPLDRVWS